MRNVTLYVFLCALLTIPLLAAETHPFSVHDMLAMDRISDPHVSPDGRSVAFVVRTTDLEANRGRTDVWRVGTDGTGLRRLTSNPASDTDPRWSPDARSIYFLSSRSGSSHRSLGGRSSFFESDIKPSLLIILMSPTPMASIEPSF